MSDGPCLSLRQEQEPVVAPDCLYSFAAWIDLNHPPLPMIAGMLELLGNELYRQARFTEGGEIKHVAQTLRGQHQRNDPQSPSGEFGGCE